MRKISQAPRRHKRSLAAAAALAAVLATAGCGGDDRGSGRQASGALPCAASVDSTGWIAFEALAARLDAGEPVERADLEALAGLPAFTRWREAYPTGPAPTPDRMANWLERAFADELGLDLPRKLNADQRTFARSYRWSRDRRDVIDARLAELDTAWCALDARLRAWMPPGSLPDTLQVLVLPAKPEIRFHEGSFFVDTGVLAAGTAGQLVRQLTGLAYRNLAVLDGPNPLNLEGEQAVAHVVRLMVNEGVATWLEDLPHTAFDPEHPTLRRVQPVPEDYWNIAVRVVGLMDQELAAMFADPEVMAARGQEFARAVVGAGGVGQGAWAMAVAIERRLGEERLREASRSVPAFLAAYQEAVRANTAPRPALHEVPGAYERALPPFSPGVERQLMALLRRTFPAGS